MTDLLLPNLKVEPRPSILGGTGLFLNSLYQEADQVLGIIPSSFILNKKTVQAYLSTINIHLPPTLDGRLTIIIFLLFYKANLLKSTTATREELLQTANTQNNPWSLYLNQLPQVVNVPTQFDATRLSLLQGTVVPTLVSSKLSRLHKEYEFVLDLLADSTSPNLEQWTSEQDFQWCDAIYWSRVLDIPTDTGEFEPALVPVLDFANHAFDQAATIYWDQHPNMDIWIKSHLPNLNPESELYLCYDTNKSNEELLFTHGFTVPNNFRGSFSLDVKADIATLIQTDASLAARVQFGVQNLRLRPIVHIRIQPVQSLLDQPILAFLNSCLCPVSLLLLMVMAIPDPLLESVIESFTDIDLQPELVLDALIQHSTQPIVNRAVVFLKDVCLSANAQISLCPQDPIIYTYCALVKDITLQLVTKLDTFHFN